MLLNFVFSFVLPPLCYGLNVDTGEDWHAFHFRWFMVTYIRFVGLSSIERFRSADLSSLFSSLQHYAVASSKQYD